MVLSNAIHPTPFSPTPPSPPSPSVPSGRSIPRDGVAKEEPQPCPLLLSRSRGGAHTMDNVEKNPTSGTCSTCPGHVLSRVQSWSSLWGYSSHPYPAVKGSLSCICLPLLGLPQGVEGDAPPTPQAFLTSGEAPRLFQAKGLMQPLWSCL